MVILNKIVIHEIIKNVNENKADKFFAKTVISISDNPNTIKLIEKVNSVYEDEEIVYSSFLESEDSNFPNHYKNYSDSKSLEADFLNFSIDTLDELRKKLKDVIPAKGGYYVYSEYTFNKEDFIGIFLIRDTEGILFKKDSKKEGFQVDTITYMNIEKLAMACRISKTKYKNNHSHYLTLIKKNQEVISDYFYKWISTSSRESNKEYTDLLYDIISQLPPPTRPDSDQLYALDDLRKDILGYIIENKRDVNLRELGTKFYRDKEIILRFAREKNMPIDHQFKADKRSLRKFKHININSDGIKVQFSHGDYTKQKIRFSDEDENIVIIESEKFAKALRKELEEYKVINASN